MYRTISYTFVGMSGLLSKHIVAVSDLVLLLRYNRFQKVRRGRPSPIDEYWCAFSAFVERYWYRTGCGEFSTQCYPSKQPIGCTGMYACSL